MSHLGRQLNLFSTLLLLHLAVQTRAASTTPSNASIPAAAQQAAEVSSGDDIPYLDSLARVMAIIRDRPTIKDEDIVPLADKLLSPTAPDGLLKLILSKVTADSAHRYQSDGSWKIGTYADRAKLVRYLLARGNRIAESDHKLSVKLCRAALVLSAYDCFAFNGGALFEVTRDSGFAARASISDANWKAFQNAFETRQATEKDFYSIYAEAMDATDSIIADEKQSVALDTVDAALKHLTAAAEVEPDDPGFAWDIVFEARNLRNLAAARHVKNAQELVDKFLRDYRQKLAASKFGKTCTEWVDETLAGFGEPPTRKRTLDAE